MTIEKSGFDLFDGGMCLGGGVTESHGVRRPRIPTVRAAEACVLAGQLETWAALRAARDAARGAGVAHTRAKNRVPRAAMIDGRR